MSDPDVRLLISTLLAQKILNGIDFPIVTTVNPFASPHGLPLGEAEIAVAPTSSDLPDFFELSAAIEDFLVDIAAQVRDGTIDTTGEDPQLLEDLRLIGSKIPGPGKSTTEIFKESATSAVGEAIARILNTKSLKVTVNWVRVEMEKPALVLGNPIVLNDTAVKVQAQIRGCIKIIKEFCATVTSPRVRIEGRKISLNLRPQGTKIFATASVDDIDIVVKIKILKWSFEIRIGITGIVNGQLKKEPPIEIVDLSSFEQAIPFSNKKARISDISISSAEGLLITATMKVS
ncbi:hypothetical protein [Massilia sp. UBA6681]|uniref:hypothetical protein n=1 Tax=Massilia sp. UBA6681 TaxID=1946839 RepID=UPI0025C445C7|nr:hypothetical protein [Massilia sp. UBA6681]